MSDTHPFKCNRCGKRFPSLNTHGYCVQCWSKRTGVEPTPCPRCLNHRHLVHHFDVVCGSCGLREDLEEMTG